MEEQNGGASGNNVKWIVLLVGCVAVLLALTWAAFLDRVVSFSLLLVVALASLARLAWRRLH